MNMFAKVLVSLPYVIVLTIFALVVLQVIFDKSAVSIYLNPAKKIDENDKVQGWKTVQVDWFFLRGMVSVIGFYFKRLMTFGKFKFDWEVQ